MAENPTAGVVQEEEEDNLEYDSDGNPIAPSKKIIDRSFFPSRTPSLPQPD